MRKSIVFLLFLIVASSLPALAADISGNWQINRTGPQGEETWQLLIKQTGNDFTVTGTHSSLGELTGSGTMDGNAITMLNYLKTPMGRIHVQFTGIVDGNNMSGNSQSVGIDREGSTGGSAPAAGGEAGAPAGAAPGAAPAAGAPAGGAPAGGAPPSGSAGGAPGGGGDAGAAGGGTVDHTKPIAFTGVKK